MKWIVITGNPVDGLHHVGPFNDHEAATEYAENFCRADDWWIAKLDTPATDD
jgi:hypothetical protein